MTFHQKLITAPTKQRPAGYQCLAKAAAVLAAKDGQGFGSILLFILGLYGLQCYCLQILMPGGPMVPQLETVADAAVCAAFYQDNAWPTLSAAMTRALPLYEPFGIVDVNTGG